MDTQWESTHLWLCLLALGFAPSCHRGVRLGRDMFAKPNSRAFTVIATFLFTKLDKSRAEVVFKKSGFRKAETPAFRKECCLWLREIAKEKERDIPPITPSSLICPGGARFVHIFYHFARYVMIEDMKKLSVGTHIAFAKAVMWRPRDMYMAKARHRVAYNKLLQILQKEDFVFQEYRKKTRALFSEIKGTMFEYAVMKRKPRKMKQNDQNKSDTTERIQKVRSMWTLIVEVLTSLKKEKEVVDSVLEDCVHPCILDGTDVILNVPRLLAHSVESDIYGYCTGNLYEDGKLNFLTVIQLLNEALSMLRDEHSPCELKELNRIEDIVTSYKKALRDLNANSIRREKLHCEQKRQSISRRQETWELKWKMILGQCPLDLVLKEYLEPVSPPSPPQCSDPSDEDEDAVLCQNQELFSDIYASPQEEHHGKDDEALETVMYTRLLAPRCDFIQPGVFAAYETTDSPFLSPPMTSSCEASLSETAEKRDLLIENNLHTETCVENEKPVSPKVLKIGKKEFPISEMQENAGEDVTQPKSPVDLLEKARDKLAEEVAKAVMSESPDSGEEKGMSLDDRISLLAFSPFLTRNQIPGTPENLLTEIRSSWRKAIQTEGSLDTELSIEMVTEKSSMDATPSVQEEIDSTLVCSEHASPVSGSDLPVSEKKSQLSSTESSPQEQVSVSHIFESSDSKTSGIQESERTESGELDCSALSGSSVEALTQTLQNVEKSTNIPDTCLKSTSRTNMLPSDHCQGFLRKTVCLNVTWSNFVSCETTDKGILEETFPESDSRDLSIAPDSDSIFFTVDSLNVTGVWKNNEGIKKSDLDIQSLSNSHEVLKKTASTSEEELHQTHNRCESESYRFELSPLEEESKNSDDDDLSVDKGFTKTPLTNSANERKCFLSSLLVSCQQSEEVASIVHEVPLDLPHKLKDGNS